MRDEFGKEVPMCEVEEIHSELIENKRREMADEKTHTDLAELFKIFGDFTRLRILFAIDGAPLCVCDIAALLGMTKSAVSHQLKILRAADLVSAHRAGKNVFYTLADDHVRDIIEKALEHIRE